MKREKEILQAYENLGYTPRDNQLQTVDEIVSAFEDLKMQNVVLCAPVGSGKSIIAAAVAEVLNMRNSNSKALMLTTTNLLSTQYVETFKKLPDEQFFKLEGSAKYPCIHLQKTIEHATAEDCVFGELSVFEQDKYCKGCTYKKATGLMNDTQNLITNYALFCISKLKSHHLHYRELQIFDEAHAIIGIITSLLSIEVSTQELDKLILLLKNHVNGKCESEAGDLALVKMTLNDFSESNYKEKLKGIRKLYNKISEKLSVQAALIPDIKSRTKIKKISTRFDRAAGQIGNLFNFEYEHVLDRTGLPFMVSVKPIFINDLVQELLSEKNLFMSGTIDKEYCATTMGLSPEKTAFITIPEVFPKENKPIHFIGKTALNYEIMKKPQTFIDLAEIISMIVEHHSEQKGIIATPSFYATKSICEKIKLGKVKLFQHLQGTPGADIVEAFKEYPEPSLLVSPSIFEGISLDDKLSEYQILLKCPFDSLGDPRIAKIAKEYPEIYRKTTLYKILQAIGRSIRSKEDYAVTYGMDKAIENLFNSKMNIWKNNYSVIK